MLDRHACVSRTRKKRVPPLWLMTDARLGTAMPAIVARMPPRSAVVIRPHAMEQGGRARAIRLLRRIARAKRHMLLLAGGGDPAGYDGRHGGGGRRICQRGRGYVSMPVHDRGEAEAARKARADAVLISPVWPTRSHPGAPSLGAVGFARLAARFPGCAVALGGMTAQRMRRLRHHGAAGWAAIDAWSR
jgi:thiamine-phosphate pyrophosphorylase